MKAARLSAASLSPLLAGENRKRICRAIILRPTFINCGYQLPGLESLKRSVHNFNSDEDDDFSELGPPINKRPAMQFKLVTEKPEWFMRNAETGRKVKPSRFPIAERSRSMTEMSMILDQVIEAPSTGKHNAAISTVNSKKNSKKKGSSTVSVGNVPSMLGIPQLVKGISKSEKASHASVRSSSDGLNLCDIKSKNTESSKRPLAAGRIEGKSVQLQIHPSDTSKVATIRLQGISKYVPVHATYLACESVGKLEGLARAENDAIDAFFRVKNDSESERLLEKLNDTFIGDCRCFASLLCSNSASTGTPENDCSRRKLGLEISHRISKLKKQQFEVKEMYLEDLQNLHMGIMHLEDFPSISQSPNVD